MSQSHQALAQSKKSPTRQLADLKHPTNAEGDVLQVRVTTPFLSRPTSKGSMTQQATFNSHTENNLQNSCNDDIFLDDSFSKMQPPPRQIFLTENQETQNRSGGQSSLKKMQTEHAQQHASLKESIENLKQFSQKQLREMIDIRAA